MKRIEKIALQDYYERYEKFCEETKSPKGTLDDFSTMLILKGIRIEADPDGQEFVYVPRNEVEVAA